MKKKLLALLFGSALILSACGGGEEAADPGNGGGDTGGDASHAQAEKLYKASCSSCHGGNLEGRVGPDLTEVGSRYTKEEIEDIIVNGKGQMSGGFLKGEEAAAVAEWLSTKK